MFVVLVVLGTTISFMDHLFGNAQMFKQCHRVFIHSDFSSEVIIVKICKRVNVKGVPSFLKLSCWLTLC